MNDINGLLGPEGVQQRMAELQRKVDIACGQSFQSYMAGAPKEISGSIGGGNNPFDPLAAGASLKANASPVLKQMISEAAQQNGLDDKLLNALVAVESGYDPSARSRTGALGLTQLMPGTASSLGVANPLDPKQSLAGGAKYLKQLLDKFGSPELALAAYNAGPNAVLKAGTAIPPYPETQNYVKRVMGLYRAGAGG